MEKVAPEAAGTKIRDLDGNEVALRTLWAKQPIVLAFVRHFG